MSDIGNSQRLRPMLDLVAQIPEQLLASPALMVELGPVRRPGRLFVCGMGGSSAAATILGGVYGADLPCHVHRGYRLPNWLDENCYLVFSSYSGNTEETLAAYADARARYPTLPSCVISSGGLLGERARADGLPMIQLPVGLPPRAAIGYGIGVLRCLFEAVQLAPDSQRDLQEASRLLRQGNELLGPSAAATENRARLLARRLYGRLPLIYGSGGLSSAVAARWSAQFNENAKVLAHVATLPEMDHNEIMGFAVAGPVREAAFVLALRDPGANARVVRRFAVTREVLGDSLRDWEEIEALGELPFVRALTLLQFGDYLSVYLAGECGVDPMDIAAIEKLKAKLSQPG